MQNPAPSGAGVSDVTDTGDLLTFPLDRRHADAPSPPRRQNSARLSGVTDTGDLLTFPLDQRCADALSPPRRRNSARLSDVTDTGDFFHPSARPQARRRSLAAPAARLREAFRRYGHRRSSHLSARPEVRRRSLAAPAAKLCKAFRRYGQRRSSHLSARPEARRHAPSPPRRRNSARLSDVTNTGDLLTFPLDRRRADTLRAHKQKRAWKLASMHVFYLCLPAAQAWSPCAG